MEKVLFQTWKFFAESTQIEDKISELSLQHQKWLPPRDRELVFDRSLRGTMSK